MKQQRKSVEAQQISEDRTLLLETICEVIPFRLENYDRKTGDDSHSLNLRPEDTALNRKSKEE